MNTFIEQNNSFTGISIYIKRYVGQSVSHDMYLSVCVSSHSVSEANRFASEASKCPAGKEAPRRG